MTLLKCQYRSFFCPGRNSSLVERKISKASKYSDRSSGAYSSALLYGVLYTCAMGLKHSHIFDKSDFLYNFVCRFYFSDRQCKERICDCNSNSNDCGDYQLFCGELSFFSSCSVGSVFYRNSSVRYGQL